MRGAKTAAEKINPDIGFAVDVGIAGDTPGISEKEAMSKMGKGPQIILYDARLWPIKDCVILLPIWQTN